MSCLYADMHIYCSYAYMLIYRRVCRWHYEALNRNPFEETFTEEKIKHVFSDIGAVPYTKNVLNNPQVRHENTEGDPGATAIQELHERHRQNLQECVAEGLEVDDLELELPVKQYKPRPVTRAEKVAQLMAGGLTPSNLWLTIGAAPINCDEVLEALDEMDRLDCEKLEKKKAKKADETAALEADVAKITAEGKPPEQWDGPELKTMLKHALKGEGFSKYNTKPKMLEKYVEIKSASSNAWGPSESLSMC